MSLQKIQSELKAPKGQTNNFGKYKYRSCEDIVEAVKPILKQYDAFLTLSDEIVVVGDRVYVKATATIAFHEGSSVSTTAFAREPLVKKGMDEAQITGATSSYARKYALNGLLAIDDTKDADTMDNSKPKPPTKAQLKAKHKVTTDTLFQHFNNNDVDGVHEVLHEINPSDKKEVWALLPQDVKQFIADNQEVK